MMKNIKKIALFFLSFVIVASTFCTYSYAQTDSSILYENNFSDAAGLSDFTTYRGDWYIKDGGLYLKASDNFPDDGNMFCHIVYTKKAFDVDNYMIDVDIYNLQTSTGILGRCDASMVSDASGNSWFGYLCFMSNDATKAAIGYGTLDGGYGGNLYVSGSVAAMGMDVHLNVKFVGPSIIFTVSDLATKNVLNTYEQTDFSWTRGTFGLRMRLTYAATGSNSIDNTYFDNLVVRKLDSKGETADASAPSTTATSAPAATTAGTTNDGKESSSPTGDVFVALTAAMLVSVSAVIYIKRRVRN